MKFELSIAMSIANFRHDFLNLDHRALCFCSDGKRTQSALTRGTARPSDQPTVGNRTLIRARWTSKTCLIVANKISSSVTIQEGRAKHQKFFENFMVVVKITATVSIMAAAEVMNELRHFAQDGKFELHVRIRTSMF